MLICLLFITGCNTNEATLYATTKCDSDPTYRVKFITDLTRQTVILQVATIKESNFIEVGGYALENCRVIDPNNFHCVGDTYSNSSSTKPTWIMSNGIMIYDDISRISSNEKNATCWYKKKFWWYSKVEGVKLP